MKPRPLSKSLVASLAAGAAGLLLTNGAPLAQSPSTDADCVVGTAAYPTIQSAVDNPECYTIQVPRGKFGENVRINANAIVHTSLTIRGAGPQLTTVDGSGAAAPVFSIGGQRASPCGDPEVAVTLEGMTITGGAGPYCPPENPRCGQRNGGGVSASPGVKLTVADCVVTGNSTYMNGGGISVANGRLTVTDSVISRNTAYANPQSGVTDPNYTGGGGGVRMAGCPGAFVVMDSVIRDNVSLRHGGGVLVNASPTLMMCVLNPGGGPCIPVTVSAPRATVVMAGVDIMQNNAAQDWGGGGVYHNYADLTVLDSMIRHNDPDDVKAGTIP